MIEGVAEEASGPVERGPAAFEMRDVELKDVMHPLLDLELDGNTRQLRAISILPRIVEQAFVGADLNEERRQAPQIAVEG
jgi:hypothetical protein